VTGDALHGGASAQPPADATESELPVDPNPLRATPDCFAADALAPELEKLADAAPDFGALGLVGARSLDAGA
jgi:hypothetical protein